MIDDKQLRAARALLNWTQETLAEASGIARATIKNIENDNSIGRRETMEALQSTLEQAGIEFLPGSGVKMRDRMVTVFEGEGANRKILEDVFQTLRDNGGEVLIANLNEGKAAATLGADFLNQHIQNRRMHNIHQRMLVSKEDRNLVPPFDTYRAVDNQYFSEYPLYIYGSKIALVSWEPAQQAILIDDKRFANSAKRLFDFVWDHSSQPAYRSEDK
jgi:transcriptional regulator with XRE-family HTH domain